MNIRKQPGLKNIVALMLTVTALAGCKTEMGDLERYITEVKARPPQPIAPIPPVKTYTPYIYEGVDGRDPFRSSTSEGNEATVASTNAGSGPRPDFDRPREYLERFELDTLEMVGTFAKDNAYWGLVRDPDGIVHRVSMENYAGKNHGKIVRINEAEIAFSELISDGAGGWLVREASIALDES